MMAGYLFVYGSLLPVLAPPDVRRLVAGMRNLGPATTAGRLYDLGSYPGLILDGNLGSVHGQAFDLPPEGKMLTELDAYEGYDEEKPKENRYVRVLRPVLLASYDEIEAWVYVFQGDVRQATIIPGGDYVAWRKMN